jgi:hypothetical protein
MPKMILIDEFHLSVSVPRGRPEPEYRTIRHTLDDRRFRTDLGQAIRHVFRRYPPLHKIRVRLSR